MKSAARRRQAGMIVFAVALILAACGRNGDDRREDRWRLPAESPKVALIGLDGATWDIVNELTARGALPNLKKLIDTGVSAEYTSIEPLLSPLIWTSIATGVTPERHGITWFMVRDPNTGTPLPITSAKREVPAIWNIASDAGKTVGFVGWWATWPAEPVNGFMISDQIAWHGFGLGMAKEEANTSKTYPEALLFEIEKDVVDPLKLSKAELDRYMNITDLEYLASAGQEFNFKNPLHHFMYMLGTLKTYEKIGLEQYAKHRPDLFGIFFESIDTTGHLYMKYRPPPIEGIPQDLYSKYNTTIDEVYKRNDEMLGRFLDQLEPGTTVVICSDHGFKTKDDRLAELENTSVSNAHKWHLRHGVLIINGPDTKAGYRLEEASVLDIAPTVLYALGLPAAEDFDGKVLTEAFTDAFVAGHAVRTVPTYETAFSNVAMPTVSPEVSKEMEEKLKSLGYIGGDQSAAEMIAAMDAIETHMNRLDMYRRKGDLASALAEAETMIKLDPDDPRAWSAIGDVHASLGRSAEALKELTKAEELIDKYKKAPPRHPNGALKYPKLDDRLMSVLSSTRAVVLMQEKKNAEAEKFFKEAQKLDDDNVMAFYNYALLLENTGRTEEAFKAYQVSAEKFPEHSFSLNNLGNMYFRKGDLQKALEYYDRTAAADPKHHECHHNKGVTLLKLGKQKEAIEEFRASLERKPDFVPALGRLGTELIRLGQYPEALEIFKKLAELVPDDVRILLQLTELYYQSGDMDSARKVYKGIKASNHKAAQAFIQKHPDFKEE